MLNENVEYQVSRGKNAPFELRVVHVSSAGLGGGGGCGNQKGRAEVEGTVQKLRERYPRFEFEVLGLEEVVGLGSVDWDALGLSDFSSTQQENDTTTGTTTKAERLRSLFENLPSTTSRTDLLRLFVRHLLISSARQSHSHALLLGSSTTALAELTLSETAKGRGFSLPWQINDGVLGVPSFSPSTSSSSEQQILIYHPLRDALRKELVTFTKLAGDPTPIADLLPGATDLTTTTTAAAAAVVSHKDLSIEEVMVRYFADVEENYPSIVANVARTTGKLMRLFGGDAAAADADGDAGKVEGESDGSEGELEEDERLCGLCTMPLDEFGDERWKGELGEDSYGDSGAAVVAGDDGGEKKKGKTTKQRICYGCERSIRG